MKNHLTSPDLGSIYRLTNAPIINVNKSLEESARTHKYVVLCACRSLLTYLFPIVTKHRRDSYANQYGGINKTRSTFDNQYSSSEVDKLFNLLLFVRLVQQHFIVATLQCLCRHQSLHEWFIKVHKFRDTNRLNAPLLSFARARDQQT